MSPEFRARVVRRLQRVNPSATSCFAPRLRLIAGILALLLVGFAGCGRGEQPGEEAFVGDRSVTLWTTLAQVREVAATLHYGDRVEIVERQNGQARVRTAAGVLGWTEQRNLLDSALWRRSRDLAERAKSMPVQARAACDRATNVHIDPGRSAPRTFQFRGGAALDVLGRAVADYTPGTSEDGAAQGAGAAAEQATRHEDWALVRTQDETAGEIAGWVLRRFVKYDIPSELVDYSTQYRFVAWFELSSVPTGETAPVAEPAKRPGEHGAPGPPQSVAPARAAAPKDMPQFLVAGIQGPDGQPCDFTLIRVYTWGATRHRYETAYVESNLCGRLPIRVQPGRALGANATFEFTNSGRGGEEHREYSMHQTSVHRTDNRRAARPRH